MGTVNLKGQPVKIIGDLPVLGSQAPDFILTSKNLTDKSLKDFAGKKKIFNIVPSLDTSVCATSTVKFDGLIQDKNNVVVLIISADLPFAQDRFCKAENTHRVHTLSMMRSRNFAKDYGVLITEGALEGITARAIVVLDETNKVIYTELVPKITQEPDYEKALAAIA